MISKYKVGDKVVMEITDEISVMEEPDYILSDAAVVNKGYIDKAAEPLSTYTEPLEAKIRRQAAEITRLLAENKELKEDFEKSKRVNLNMGRRAGQNEAWELARKIAVIPKDGGYGGSKLIEIFNTTLNNEIFNLTYPEVAAKVAEWEKAKEEVKVGDVLEDIYVSKVKCVVTNLYPDNMAYSIFGDGTAGMHELNNFKKTGRHIDIDGFLKQIGEE